MDHELLSGFTAEPLKPLREHSAADLMQELCNRGALKVLMRTTYLPGIVAERYREGGSQTTDNPALTRATAQAIHDFTRDLLHENVLSVESKLAHTLPGYRDVAPTDTVIEVSLLVPNPSYDEEDHDV